MTDRGPKKVISAVARAFQPRAKENVWDSGNQGAERKGNIVEDLLGAPGAMWCLEKTTPHSRKTPSPRDPLLPSHFSSFPKNGLMGNAVKISPKVFIFC